MRWALAAAAGIALAIGPMAADAHAASPKVDLVWSVPPGECPSNETVVEDVRAILADSSTTGTTVRARAVVKHAEVTGRWHVDLSIESSEGSGERTFDGDSCAELARAVALIVALAIDPTRRDATPPPPPQQPPPAQPPPPPPPAREDTPSSQIVLGAAAIADFGTMPSPGAGASVWVGGLILRRRVRVEARGRILSSSQRASDIAHPTQGVDLTFLGGDARGCFAVVATADHQVDVSPCLGVDLERLSGSGFGGQKTFSDATARFAFAGGVLGTWALASWLALRVGANAVLPTSRSSFVVLAPDGVTHAGSLHRPSVVTGWVEAGAELRF